MYLAWMFRFLTELPSLANFPESHLPVLLQLNGAFVSEEDVIEVLKFDKVEVNVTELDQQVPIVLCHLISLVSHK